MKSTNTSSVGRMLSDSQLSTLRAAVSGAIVAAAILCGDLSAQTCSSGSSCVVTGYPPGFPPYGAPGGGGGGTTNPNCTADCDPAGSAPPASDPAIPWALVPPMVKVLCGAEKYGAFHQQYYTNFLNIFTFQRDLPGGSVWTSDQSSNVPPAGFYLIDALTNDNPYNDGVGRTTLYASSAEPYSYPLTYIPVGSSSPVTIQTNYTAIEHSVLTAAHEFAHQNGITNEEVADGYGVQAADAYRADHGAQCQ